VYKTVTREELVTAASSREIAIPAVYKTVTRQVVDTAPTSREIPVAAVMKTLSRRVIDVPATTRAETVQAVYKTVSRQVVDVAASTREVDVPAQYETLSQQVKVGEATTEWRSILCETNATEAKIKEIQRALAVAGFDPGPVDGVIREKTMRAVNSYQQSKNLPVDSYLNLPTVKSLGVSAN
jgi:hypothetical protein